MNRGGSGMGRSDQGDGNEPFFITEEIGAALVAAGYEFDPPPIACAGRLGEVLERMSDAELALQPGEIAARERARRQQKRSSID
jgi:hypothetical protein